MKVGKIEADELAVTTDGVAATSGGITETGDSTGAMVTTSAVITGTLVGIELPGLPGDGLLADDHVLSGQDHAAAGDRREPREERRGSLGGRG